MGNAKLVDLGHGVRRSPDAVIDSINALANRDRMVLAAYMRFATLASEKTGEPMPICWPTDAQIAACVGRSAATVRRSRAILANLPAPWIALRYVPKGGSLPDGSTTVRGIHVVTILKVGAPEEGPAVQELAAARTTVRQLELDLASARERVRVLEEDIGRIHAAFAANDEASASRKAIRPFDHEAASPAASHNAPTVRKARPSEPAPPTKTGVA